MGQKICRIHVKEEDNHFIGLSPIEISKEIINSSDYYRSIIDCGMIWKTSEPTRWKNYIYEINSWDDKTTLYIHNSSPFKSITPISDDHKCYICLDDQNVDCKMHCCNYYLHYNCAIKLEPNSQCSICKKSNLIKINIYHCKSCNQVNYSEDLEQVVCNDCKDTHNE